jgi:hypothetical protein
MKLRAGDWVEIRSAEEILRTLDERGRLEGLPFMPEMFQFCGRRVRVAKRAHKTCDSVNKTGARRMRLAVHLEGLRCDGSVHGGCEAGCLLFWKEAWLRRITDGSAGEPVAPAGATGCTREQVFAATRAAGSTAQEPLYSCQATELPAATLPLKRTDPTQYLEDVSSGNISPGRLLAGLIFCAYRWLSNLGIGVGRPMRWAYDAFQKLIGGVPFPYRPGKIPIGGRTPVEQLNLQPGEWVRVKPYEEILKTIDGVGMNRGMLFNQEMVPYCGKTFRVARRVNRLIHEQTGQMLQMKTPGIILEGVECEARYIERQLFCPRGTYHFWREIWLERVNQPDCVAAPGVPCPKLAR